MQKLLENQTAIVTGATAGIGQAIAETLAEQGAWVAMIGTNQERGTQVASEINRKAGQELACFFSVNVSKTAEVEEAVKLILSKRPSIDILVNNAGITKDQLLLRMSEEEWDAVMTTNLKSCYNWCKPVSRAMLKPRKGRIINISSVVGLIGGAGQGNYAASKAGIIGLTKSLAKELASRNILVNCIAPGFIETKMTDVLSEDRKKEIAQSIPLGRIGKPKEVADVALFLASNLSNYMTGQVLTVDGGMVM